MNHRPKMRRFRDTQLFFFVPLHQHKALLRDLLRSAALATTYYGSILFHYEYKAWIGMQTSENHT